MTDLQKLVEDNRGLLKKIELCLPGFRGYRQRDDLRAADNMLRSYLADQLEAGSQKKMLRVREILTKSMNLALLNDLGELININKGLIARIRHAEHGYSGISPQFQIREPELNRIYEFDDKLLSSIAAIQAKSEVLLRNTKENTLSEIPALYSEIRDEIDSLNELFENRQLQLIGLMRGNGGV